MNLRFIMPRWQYLEEAFSFSIIAQLFQAQKVVTHIGQGTKDLAEFPEQVEALLSKTKTQDRP